MSNPYESPQFVGQATIIDPGDRDRLRRVARRQQGVLYALLAQVAAYALVILLLAAGFPGLAQNVSYLSLLVALFGMVAVFLLAKELLHIVIAVICTVLMLFPCISLLTLLIVSAHNEPFFFTAYLQLYW